MCCKVNVQARFVFIRVTPCFTCFGLLLFLECASMVLLLWYICSWCVRGQKALKLCPWLLRLLLPFYCHWSPLRVIDLPVRTLGCCCHPGSVTVNSDLAGNSQWACLSCPELWLWGRHVLRPKGVQIEMSQGLAPTLHSSLLVNRTASYLPSLGASQGPKTPGRNKYFRSQNPKAR